MVGCEVKGNSLYMALQSVIKLCVVMMSKTGRPWRILTREGMWFDSGFFSSPWAATVWRMDLWRHGGNTGREQKLPSWFIFGDGVGSRLCLSASV